MYYAYLWCLVQAGWSDYVYSLNEHPRWKKVGLRRNEALWFIQPLLSRQTGFTICPFCHWARREENDHTFCEENYLRKWKEQWGRK